VRGELIPLKMISLLILEIILNVATVVKSSDTPIGASGGGADNFETNLKGGGGYTPLEIRRLGYLTKCTYRLLGSAEGGGSTRKYHG